MRTIQDIFTDLDAIDSEIARLLAKRMSCVEEIIQYKKESGVAIFQPEQDEKIFSMINSLLEGSTYEKEELEIFRSINSMSKKVQAKSLFKKNIALIGFMGAGKTTVSNYLKQMLAMDEVDTDAEIVRQEGMPITEIFDRYGEDYFRNCESNVIIELQKSNQLIISCGGGAVLRKENVKNLKKGSYIVLLTASPETTLERVKDSNERPILNGHMNVEYIKTLQEKRKKIYEEAADIIIETDGKNAQEICEELVHKLIKINS